VASFKRTLRNSCTLNLMSEMRWENWREETLAVTS